MKKSFFIAILATLATGCASTSQVSAPAPAQQGPKVACGSFFVYEMCMTDRAGDQRVDYMWFSDDNTIFMYQAGEPLPADKPVHRCAMPMSDDVLAHSSRLLYGEDLNLLEEMDVKRKLLLSYMSAKEGVESCYNGDGSPGEATANAEGEFMSDDYDWGED